MKKIGITGQSGFIGSHLFNFLSLKRDEFELIPFEDTYFSQQEKLFGFVRNCDVIVHLAAVNRHSDPNLIYITNIALTNQLINAFEITRSRPHVLFASSTQEEKDNQYGKSKKECRELLLNWAFKNDSKFTGLIIPNVFGPAGRPFYNSVIATFSYQLTHNIQPNIEIDAELSLIYINDLIEEIYKIIVETKSVPIYNVPFHKKIMVSEILVKLSYFRQKYFEENITPILNEKFEIDLFNTFISYYKYVTN
jgi:UDP-2-acetamido-2,6-beta-L-arabino-hexul-4-ose reductase